MRNSIFKLLSKQFISLSFARLSLALLFAAVTMAASFPANAGISQVTGQKFQLPNQGAGTTTSGHFANPPAIGNTILVYVWSWGGSTTTPMPAISVTDNYGNAYSSLPQAVTCNGSPGCEYVAILSAIVVNTGSSFTLTATTANNGPPYTGSSEVGAIALEYTGLAGMDLQNTAVGTVADPTISFPTGQTTNNSNELVAAIVSPLLPAAGYSAIAPSSPWVEEGISTNNCNFAAGEMADQILSTPSNPSITWTPAPVNLGSPCSNGAFTSWVAAIVSLNPDLGCHSIKSGNWSDPTVWSCGVVPPAGGTATIYAGPVTIDGSTNIMTKVTIDSGSTLISGSGGVLNLGGTAGSAAIINSGTLNLGGAGSVVLGNTLSLAGSGSWTFNNLTAGANTINASALASSATVNVTGNLSSRGTFTSGSDTWAFTGSGAQTITGALTFAKLKINNTGSGVTLVSNSNVSVSNALTMTKGVIQTGTNSLIYSPNCVTSPITVSSGSYINGNLNLNFPTGNSTCIFPIGDSTNYAPMTIKTTGNGGTLTGSTVAVPDLTTLTGNPAPTTIIAATDSVNRTWTVGLAATDTLSPNNLNTATFNYCNAVGTGCGVNDVALGASYSYFVALQEVGTTWSQIPTHSVTFNSNNTVVTGLSNFGTFVMGQPTSKVTSINCTSACTTPVFAKTVSWTVTFSQSVTGVQTRDFATVPSAGLPGTSVASVTGSGTTWTVTAYVGTGSGTLGLNLIAAGGTDIPGLMASSPYPPVIFTGQVYTNVSGPAMAVYHMDESAWGSSGTPVSDSSGNGYNAKAMNGATTASTNPLAAIQGNPGTCSYGEMTYSPVSDGYVQTPLPHLATNFTVTAWIYPANVNYVGSRIFVDDNGSQGYGLSIDDGAGHLRFYDRGISSVVLDSNYQLSNNAWYFVAAVADISNGKRYIYVFNSTGTLLNVTQDTTSFTGTWTTGNGTVNIGSSESYFFQGNLDEVQIFNEALTPAAVSSLATQTHVCSTASLDHILIQSSGSGLTCAANTLTLVACQNTDCSTTYSGGVSGTLSYTGAGSVNWDSSTGGGTGANFSIASGSTTITKNMQTTTAGTGIFGLAAEIPLAPNGATCNFGNPLCTFTTSTAGFIFSNTDTGGSNTPAQVSGIASPLYLRAVQASTTNAAVCTPAIINQTASPLMGFVCNNPAACQAGELVTITNATTSAATPIATGSPGTTSVSLNFDANGSAPITVLYYDVGQITLNANMTATPFSGATTVTLNGSSNAFVVKPDHYDLSNVACTTVAASTCAPANSSGNNPAASNAAGAAFIQAGQPFTATITAMNKLNNPTPNYGNESPPQGVSLTPTLVAQLRVTSRHWLIV